MSAPSRANGLEQAEIEAACSSKNRYPDYTVAMAMGMSQEERYGDRLYTYRCRICRGWHLTKSKHGKDGNPAYPCSEERQPA